MIKFTPILLAVLYALVMYQFSAWRTRRQLDASSTRLMDPGLKPVLDRLAQALDVPEVAVYIYEVDPINGLAAPDGRIFITRGFYEAYRSGKVSAEELASVIAHELGHVSLGHTRRRMVDFSGQNALRVAAGMILSRVLPGIGVWLANALASLLAAKLSRSDEFEADEYATALMMKAGLPVDAQKSLFSKLNALTGQRGGVTPAWLMSHPKTEERVAAIEARQAKWAGSPK